MLSLDYMWLFTSKSFQISFLSHSNHVAGVQKPPLCTDTQILEHFHHCRMQRGGPQFNSWVRKIPWRREWLPTPLFLPGESHGQRSLAGYSPWDDKETDMTEWLTLPLFLDQALTLGNLLASCWSSIQIKTYSVSIFFVSQWGSFSFLSFMFSLEHYFAFITWLTVAGDLEFSLPYPGFQCAFLTEVNHF